MGVGNRKCYSSLNSRIYNGFDLTAQRQTTYFLKTDNAHTFEDICMHKTLFPKYNNGNKSFLSRMLLLEMCVRVGVCVGVEQNVTYFIQNAHLVE